LTTSGLTIEALQAAGKTSLRAIADGLNEQGISTARGAGKWSAVQVARVLPRESVLTQVRAHHKSGRAAA